MSGRTTTLGEALTQSRQVRIAMGREIQLARTAAGVSQRTAGSRVGMSHAQFGRIERAELDELSVDQLCRACAAVGLKAIFRAVPGAGPALDAGQLALLGRLRTLLPSNISMRTEVPLPLQGDRRAWDAVLGLEPDPTPVEAEARLRDLQAMDRRCALKLRDSPYGLMVLLVSDTANNREVLRTYREQLRASYPLETRAVMQALRTGRTPSASGIVVL